MVQFVKPQRKVHTVFLHCSASSAKAHDDVSVMRNWHLARGWKDVGYHYFIKRNGTIQSGRSIEKTPAAQKGHNSGSIAICMHGAGGNPPKNDFTQAQFRALKDFCLTINRAYKGQIRFRGHCEVAAKACPVYDYHKALMLDADGYMIGTPHLPTKKNEPPIQVAQHSIWKLIISAIINFFKGGK